MKKRQPKIRIQSVLIVLITVAFLCALGILAINVLTSEIEEEPIAGECNIKASQSALPSTSGQLRVSGTKIVDKNNNVVALRGPSTHGVSWYGQYLNEDLFRQINDEVGCNVIRLAMYSKNYVEGDKEYTYQQMKKGIDAAISANLYVIVDWHVLDEHNPLVYEWQAAEFFDRITKDYPECENIIYEICNEPNGETTWDNIKEYAENIIPVIRKNSKSNIILVGTPDYDREPWWATNNPITIDDNLMYTLHFYSASHKSEIRQRLIDAQNAGTPMFISECGMSDDSGNGELDFDEAAIWFEYLQNNDISFTIWSLSNKEEASAMIRNDVIKTSNLFYDDLTPSGKYAFGIFVGENPYSIPTDPSRTPYWYCSNFLGWVWLALLGIALLIILTITIISRISRKAQKKKFNTYSTLIKKTQGYPVKEDVNPKDPKIQDHNKKVQQAGKILLQLFMVVSITYLGWRTAFSIPLHFGVVAIICNLVLLVVEILGFSESVIHFVSISKMKDYALPNIPKNAYPDIDIFVSTYNEPKYLLRKTLIGCKNMFYPDKSKVHIYLCDDNRRKKMRDLAAELGVNYLDRPNNDGAKAGNLNNALKHSSSPYIVTFDADMIPREEFLLKTVPYFVDAEYRNKQLDSKKQIKLGLIQTPQSFYTPDVFQYNLYSEHLVPNEQDFFYRTIEPAKTESNSVIYGGSNTLLSREALQKAGGFYTESITEDFATGMLIESNGYVSLGLSEPLASGMAPSNFSEHIQQRIRWGRGVIATARNLKIIRSKNLSYSQKLSYLSSLAYWYNPLVNFVFILCPLIFVICGVPIFRCTWQELLVFWLPMFILQKATLFTISRETISTKWSGIQDICMMPFLAIPVTKEFFGITMNKFNVTSKDGKTKKRDRRPRQIIPFAIFVVLSIVALVVLTLLFIKTNAPGLFVVGYWIVRNLYMIIMSLFLVDGRDFYNKNTIVKDTLYVNVSSDEDGTFTGTTTTLTEHTIAVYIDGDCSLGLGQPVEINIEMGHYYKKPNEKTMHMQGSIIKIDRSLNNPEIAIYLIQILDYCGQKDQYVYSLYNRLPSLPQRMKSQLWLKDLWRNFALHLKQNL